MTLSIRKVTFFFFLLGLILRAPLPLFADFKLLDAIEEFGEKRFVKPLPTHLHAGPVTIHPVLRSSYTYDDNILLEKTDAREDSIFNIQPGAILELPIQKHQLAIGYDADFEIFSKSRHARQNDQNQNAFALADFRFLNWYVNVLENFSETSSRAGTTFTTRIPRFDQSINPKIGYRWKRMIFEAGYRNYIRDFRRQVDDSLDFQINEWTGVLYYDLFARLKALLEYQFAHIDYDDNAVRVGTVNQVRIGLEGEIFPNLTSKIRVGPQFRNYKVSSKPDFYSVVGDISLEYQVRKNLKLTTGFSRQAVEATFGDISFYREHLFKLGAEYKWRPEWAFFSEMKLYRHAYAERATVDTRSGYRRDMHVGLKTGIKYVPREWWELELAYQFLRRNSNFSTFDFSDNQISLTSYLTY